MVPSPPHPKGRDPIRALQIAGAGTVALAAASSVACGDDFAPGEAVAPLGRRPRPETRTTETTAHAYSARRCGECHQRAFQEWELSTHAMADRSEVYLAMVEDSGRTDCDRCHAPLRPLLPQDQSVIAEGVTCDVCHTLRTVEPDPRSNTGLHLQLESTARYGTICNLDDHYFHTMGCSPLYSQAQLCGGCHLWTTHTSAAAELEMLTTYADWRSGTYATIPCQGCHMAVQPGEIAVGWGPRERTSSHRMLGPELRDRAIGIELRVEPTDRALLLHVDVVNTGAGHPLPAGFPARRIILQATAFGADGERLDRQERVYGRIFVDQGGAEVPFYAAHHMRSDTRIAPDEHRPERFSFVRAGVAELRVEVFDHPISATIAEAVGVAPPAPTRLTSARATSLGPRRWRVRTP